MRAAAAKQDYSRADVLRLLGLSERQLRSWERMGLAEPAGTYHFHELVALRTLARLRAAKISSARIRRVLAALRRKLRDVANPLTELKIYVDGNRIRVQVGAQKMEPESGQLLLDFGESDLQRLVALPTRAEHERMAAVRRKQAEAEDWFRRGIQFEQTGAPIERAMDAYKVAIALDPTLAAAMVNLGTIYFTAKDWDAAEKCYSQALQASPDYPLAHFNMGNLYDERADRAKALYHYQQAIRLDPFYADAHYNLALLYQSTGQLMKAIRFWRAYLRLDASSSWADIARRELEKLYARAVVRRGAPGVAPSAP